MPQLVIDYRLDTKQPGYAFSSPVNGVSEGIRKVVWRHAMPRGKGWGEFPGMRSIKCFPVSDALAAVSTITVTDQEDEQASGGHGGNGSGPRPWAVSMMALKALVKTDGNKTVWR